MRESYNPHGGMRFSNDIIVANCGGTLVALVADYEVMVVLLVANCEGTVVRLVANYEGTVVTLVVCVNKQIYEKGCSVHLF
jgi:hypothetical protein